MNNIKRQIYFYKGSKNYLDKDIEKREKCDNNNQSEIIQKEFLKVLDTQNLSFLLGAGCSSYIENKNELGIPTMQELTKDFYEVIHKPENQTYCNFFNNSICDKIEGIETNIEKLMEFLFAYQFVYERQKHERMETNITNFIDFIQKFIFHKCSNEEQKIVELYEKFYRKLLMRDANLSKINIFTTNYDLFNERALDKLGIIYCNGFSGVIERFFNPAVFNYAFAEQMDINHDKWNIIDNFIYLYKLHGSINWVEDESEKHLFKIKEMQKPCKDSYSMMIYPTPMKQNTSFGSPYADIFREFQRKLMKPNNVLVVIGYSFGDEHINNIIYQALTIPTFRLIVIGKYDSNENMNKLFSLQDDRIWFIYGEQEPKIHYFENFIKDVLPDFEQNEIEFKLEKVKEIFVKRVQR